MTLILIIKSKILFLKTYKVRHYVLLSAIERGQNIIRRQVDLVVVEVFQHGQKRGRLHIRNVDEVFAGVGTRQPTVQHCVEHCRACR
jgi:hypothetical protein